MSLEEQILSELIDSQEALIKRVNQLERYLIDHGMPDPSNNLSLEKKISDCLNKLGISQNSGYVYMEEILTIAITDRRKLTHIAKIYTTVAEKYGCTEVSIKASIRRNIKCIFKGEYSQNMQDILGNIDGIPTNQQFLTKIVDYIRLKMK